MVQKQSTDQAAEKPRTTVEMYLRTTVLVMSWITMGICGEIVGPTMGVLAHNTNVTFNGMATALAFANIGGLIANILCGIFQNFITKQQDLFISLAFFLRAILACATPFIHSLIILCCTFFCQGIIGSVANMEGTDLLFQLWGTRVAAPLNIVHFGYGLGAIIANFLVRPYLNHKTGHVNVNGSIGLNSTLSRSVSIPIDADIRIPYMIAAGSCILVAIMNFCFFLWRNIHEKEKEKEKINYTSVNRIDTKSRNKCDKEVKYSQYSPIICGHGYFNYGLSISILFTVYMFFVVGVDQTFAKFYFSFLKFDKFNISTNGASWGIILFWLFFSIGRLIGTIESIFIPVTISLSISWCGGFLLMIIWIVYVWILELTSTSLYVIGALTGLIIGPLFALSYAWIKYYLNVIPLLLAITLCGCGLGSICLQKIAGFLMDRAPHHFPTLLTIAVLICITLYTLLNLVVFFHQRKLSINQIPGPTDQLNEEEKKIAEYLENVNEIA